MAWIEQTKKGSIKSGGPQYYLQDLTPNSKELLGTRRRCPVRLWTPYGVVDSGLVAVSSGVGRVGHDRVQSGRKVPSIAEQVATWYSLRLSDIERVEFEDSFDSDCFVIRPSKVRFRGRPNLLTVYPDSCPLTLTSGHRSSILLGQIEAVKRRSKDELIWIASQVRSLAEQHARNRWNVDERDLLRASGALHKMGIDLGMYRSRGIDCPEAKFRFGALPEYGCPVEIEEKSSGFLADNHAPHWRQRIVVLCMEHDAPAAMQGYVDILELHELDRVLGMTA